MQPLARAETTELPIAIPLATSIGVRILSNAITKSLNRKTI